MIRDKIKNREYFDQYIQYKFDKIKEFEELIKKVIQSRGVDDAVKNTWLGLLNDHIAILIAMYARGDEIQEIKKYYVSVLDTLERVDFTHRYVEMLWLISIGIMLDQNDIDFTLLSRISDRDHLKDPLLNFLISQKVKDSHSSISKIKFAKPYLLAYDIVNVERQQAAAKLREYLTKAWYRGHSDMGWHDAHKSNEDIYFGYWSFESGALVKVLGLDDHAFKDNQYYPYDMVHWNS